MAKLADVRPSPSVEFTFFTDGTRVVAASLDEDKSDVFYLLRAQYYREGV